MRTTPSTLAATSRLVSSAVVRDLATSGRSTLFTRLLRETDPPDAMAPMSTVADIFEAAFGFLRLGEARDEYVYKAALTHTRFCSESTPCAPPACSLAVLDALRADEAKALLIDLGLPVPEVPNTRVHAALREAFQDLSPLDAHKGMVDVLKRKRDLRSLSDLIDQLPPSLQPASLSLRLCKVDHGRLVRALATSAATPWPGPKRLCITLIFAANSTS